MALSMCVHECANTFIGAVFLMLFAVVTACALSIPKLPTSCVIVAHRLHSGLFWKLWNNKCDLLDMTGI